MNNGSMTPVTGKQASTIKGGREEGNEEGTEENDPEEEGEEEEDGVEETGKKNGEEEEEQQDGEEEDPEEEEDGEEENDVVQDLNPKRPPPIDTRAGTNSKMIVPSPLSTEGGQDAQRFKSNLAAAKKA